jgi:hypothetical protein
MNPRDAFLCYAWEDKAAARSFSLGLGQYGVTTSLDEAEMRPGDRLVDKLAEAIHDSRWFIILLTANSVAKSWVKFELSQAMDREVRAGVTSVIPVVLSDCEIPLYLRNKVYVDLRDYGDYEHGIQRLAATIKGDLAEPPPGFLSVDVGPMSDQELLALPRSQSLLEMNLRSQRWTSRRLRTLSQLTGLMPKQVITYCERMPHIVVSPIVNAMGDVFYGRRDRILPKYRSEAAYLDDLARFLSTLRTVPSQSHPHDVISHFFSFHGP